MKRCLIIINPSSGKHIIQNKLDRIIGQLTLQNIVEHFEIFYTEKKDDAYYKTRDCDENQYDFIMSVGGDGTLNEVISGMVDSHKKIPLCILAAGTVNDFANYLNIPNSVNGIVEIIARIGFAFLLTAIPFIGMWGIWFTTGLTWLVTAVFAFWRYRGGAWMSKSLVTGE